jgi:signal transduction histidine kinase
MSLMSGLYEPSMSEKGIRVEVHSNGSVRVQGDAALIHRMVTNLLNNELTHLPDQSKVAISLRVEADAAILRLEDNGRGFDSEVLQDLFDKRVKGRASRGHGLGMAFVGAVARAHGGSVTAGNRDSGGAWIEVALPLEPSYEAASLQSH